MAGLLVCPEQTGGRPMQGALRGHARERLGSGPGKSPTARLPSPVPRSAHLRGRTRDGPRPAAPRGALQGGRFAPPERPCAARVPQQPPGQPRPGAVFRDPVERHGRGSPLDEPSPRLDCRHSPSRNLPLPPSREPREGRRQQTQRAAQTAPASPPRLLVSPPARHVRGKQTSSRRGSRVRRLSRPVTRSVGGVGRAQPADLGRGEAPPRIVEVHLREKPLPGASILAPRC